MYSNFVQCKSNLWFGFRLFLVYVNNTSRAGKEQFYKASYYKQISADIKILKNKIKTSLLAPRCRRHRLNNFQYSLEPVPIQRILIGFEAILEIEVLRHFCLRSSQRLGVGFKYFL